MATVQLSDELQRVIDRQVAEGRASSPAAFLEEAIRRLLDETQSEEHELRQVVEAGDADIETGRFTTIATPDDHRRLHDGMMARLQARLPSSR